MTALSARLPAEALMGERPLRVLQVIPTLGALSGGPVAAVAESSRALVEIGVSSTIVATDQALPAWTKGQRPVTRGDLPSAARDTDVVLLRAQRPHRLAFSPDLFRDLRRRAPENDVVHIHSLYLFPQFAAGSAARRAGVPYVVSPRGALDPWLRQRGRLRKRLTDLAWQRRLLEGAALIHVTTAEEGRLNGDVAPQVPRYVVPNGIDWGKFQQLPDDASFRERFLRGHRGPVVLSLGRLHEKKGLDVLVEAFVRVLAARPDAMLVLAGPDDGAGTALLELAQRRRISEHVVFTGMLVGDDKLAALAAATVWALPSHTENFGIAVVEALASGVPTVVSTAVNLAPTIVAADAGRVVEAAPWTFGDAIVSLLLDDVDRLALGRRGRSFARRYDWRSVAPQLEAMYRLAIQGGGS